MPFLPKAYILSLAFLYCPPMSVPSALLSCHGEVSECHECPTSTAASITTSHLIHHHQPCSGNDPSPISPSATSYPSHPVYGQEARHSSHQSHSGQPWHACTSRCDDAFVGRSKDSSSQALDVLQQFCEDLPSHTALDAALLQQWRRDDLKARLFDDEGKYSLFEDDVKTKPCDKDELMAQLSGEDESKLFDENVIVPDDDHVTPCSSPLPPTELSQTPRATNSVLLRTPNTAKGYKRGMGF